MLKNILRTILELWK